MEEVQRSWGLIELIDVSSEVIRGDYLYVGNKGVRWPYEAYY